LLPIVESFIIHAVAGVAQLVEQRIRNAKVTSSIPVIGTILPSLVVSVSSKSK
jgi:hypothetical protein